MKLVCAGRSPSALFSPLWFGHSGPDSLPKPERCFGEIQGAAGFSSMFPPLPWHQSRIESNSMEGHTNPFWLSPPGLRLSWACLLSIAAACCAFPRNSQVASLGPLICQSPPQIIACLLLYPPSCCLPCQLAHISIKSSSAALNIAFQLLFSQVLYQSAYHVGQGT